MKHFVTIMIPSSDDQISGGNGLKLGIKMQYRVSWNGIKYSVYITRSLSVIVAPINNWPIYKRK